MREGGGGGAPGGGGGGGGGGGCPFLTVSFVFLRVRVEIRGSGKYEIVGKSQSVIILINPIIFTRKRSFGALARHEPSG
eukprot:COSAG01_NODE_72942_length_251_cov_1.447368_1_plen_78_part_10